MCVWFSDLEEKEFKDTGLDMTFEEYGGDSMKAMQIAGIIHDQHGVELPADMLSNPTTVRTELIISFHSSSADASFLRQIDLFPKRDVFVCRRRFGKW